MKLSDVDALLDASPLALEMGIERLDDGVLHVAVRTDMHGCSGEMFEWWFRYRPDTTRYIWWHPVDHVSSAWSEGQDGTHVGSIHVVEEFFTGLPAEKLSIQFRDSEEFFDASKYRAARRQGNVSAAICGRVGFSHQPPRTDAGAVLGGRLLHIGRDTSWGFALRSHFFMGQDLPSLGEPPAQLSELFPDRFGKALLMHCYNEFTFLSRFLPSLFIAENRKSRPVRTPWQSIA
jgi:hypothetical protein